MATSSQFVRITVIDIEGLPYEKLLISRIDPPLKKGKAKKITDNTTTFTRNLDHFFDSHLVPGRVFEIGVIDREEKVHAYTTIDVKKISDMCLAQEGGLVVTKFDLFIDAQKNKGGKITISAQAHPRRDRVLTRRGAQKLAKVHIHLGHHFVVKMFTELSRCAACNKPFWGLCQEYQCNFCETTVHKECLKSLENLIEACTHMELPKLSILEQQHEFCSINSLLLPKMCKSKGKHNRLMWLWFGAAQRCEHCGLYAHASCAQSFHQPCLGRSLVKFNPISSTDSVSDDYYDYVSYQYPALLPDAEAFEHAKKYPWLLRREPYDLGNFELLRLIGRGSFGNVYLARFRPDNGGMSMLVALKSIRKDKAANNLLSTRIERKVLQIGSRSPFILNLMCTFQTGSHLFYAVEFIRGGALIFHLRFGKFKVDKARFYASEVICGLEFLHRNEIIYRDLKAENVMLDDRGHVKLIDFGLSKDEMSPGRMTRSICGTISHLAPEVVTGKPYSFSADWWSFGVFLYEMLVGLIPFTVAKTELSDRSLAQLIWQFNDPTLPSYEDISDQSAVAVLKLLFERTPELRLGSPSCPAGAIRSQQFFSSLDWNLIETGKAVPPPLPSAEEIPPRLIALPNGEGEEQLDVRFIDFDSVDESIRLSRVEEKLMEVTRHMLGNFSITNIEFKRSSCSEQ